jgi:hypothetical protein
MDAYLGTVTGNEIGEAGFLGLRDRGLTSR